MAKPRKNELIRCQHFTWRLFKRNGTWYGDGRSKQRNAGRFSLGTSDKQKAIERLPKLDRRRAVKLGLLQASDGEAEEPKLLDLDPGWTFYMNDVKRPYVTGGVRKTTAERYVNVYDKFGPFAKSHHITTWNGVDAALLKTYAAHLKKEGYSDKTVLL